MNNLKDVYLIKCNGEMCTRVKAENALKDKEIVLFYFSAHWCGPCRKFTPVLKDFYKALNDDTVEIVFVSSDRSPDAMMSYMKESHGAWPAIEYNEGVANGLKQKMGISGIPTLVVCKKDGSVITKDGRGHVTSKSPKQAVAEWKRSAGISDSSGQPRPVGSRNGQPQPVKTEKPRPVGIEKPCPLVKNPCLVGPGGKSPLPVVSSKPCPVGSSKPCPVERLGKTEASGTRKTITVKGGKMAAGTPGNTTASACQSGRQSELAMTQEDDLDTGKDNLKTGLLVGAGILAAGFGIYKVATKLGNNNQRKKN